MPGRAWQRLGKRLASMPPVPAGHETVRMEQEHCEGCGRMFPWGQVRIVRVGAGDLPDAFQGLCGECRGRLGA